MTDRMSHTQRTEAAYDATAQRYHARWHDRDPLAPEKERLVSAMPVGGRLLDVGCGTGRDLAWFARGGFETVGVDRSSAMLHLAREASPTTLLVRGDLRRLPFPDETFDGWWASASLLHIGRSEMPHVLAGLLRSTRPEGVGYLSLKVGNGEALDPVDGSDHARYFCYWQAEELDRALTVAGWEMVHRSTDADALGRQPWLTRLVRRPARVTNAQRGER